MKGGSNSKTAARSYNQDKKSYIWKLDLNKCSGIRDDIKPRCS